jgi:5'-nucleotidase
MTDMRDTLRTQPLRIGISTRALFNLEEEHAVSRTKGGGLFGIAARAGGHPYLERAGL